jgi:hypothetical protein
MPARCRLASPRRRASGRRLPAASSTVAPSAIPRAGLARPVAIISSRSGRRLLFWLGCRRTRTSTCTRPGGQVPRSGRRGRRCRAAEALARTGPCACRCSSAAGAAPRRRPAAAAAGSPGDWRGDAGAPAVAAAVGADAAGPAAPPGPCSFSGPISSAPPSRVCPGGSARSRAGAERILALRTAPPAPARPVLLTPSRRRGCARVARVALTPSASRSNCSGPGGCALPPNWSGGVPVRERWCAGRRDAARVEEFRRRGPARLPHGRQGTSARRRGAGRCWPTFACGARLGSCPHGRPTSITIDRDDRVASAHLRLPLAAGLVGATATGRPRSDPPRRGARHRDHGCDRARSTVGSTSAPRNPPPSAGACATT